MRIEEVWAGRTERSGGHLGRGCDTFNVVGCGDGGAAAAAEAAAAAAVEAEAEADGCDATAVTMGMGKPLRQAGELVSCASEGDDGKFCTGKLFLNSQMALWWLGSSLCSVRRNIGRNEKSSVAGKM